MSRPLPLTQPASTFCQPRRRDALALLGSSCLALSACSGLPRQPPPGSPIVALIDARTGTRLNPIQWQARLADTDFLLLGEQHDNPHHHTLRGQWLAALPEALVVAEHLPRGQRVVWQGGTDAAVLASLQAAGFEPEAWDWPLHLGLFAPLARSGRALWGGNAPREAVRQVARQGATALPSDLAPSLLNAPLTPAAEAALDAELQAGHCGQLPATALPGMRWAQRARDAAMGQSLLDAAAAGAHPAVLVAGNGHVRPDWGVAQWLRAQRPTARVLSVALLEAEHPLAQAAAGPGWPADAADTAELLCLTTGVPQRPDPCEGLQMPRP